MRFTCRTCKKVLRKPLNSSSLDGEMLASPWYRADGGLNHLPIACLHCGTIHDFSVSIFKTLVAALTGDPWKVHGDFSPMEIGVSVLNAVEAGMGAREALKAALSPPDGIVDALVERELLGQAFHDPPTSSRSLPTNLDLDAAEVRGRAPGDKLYEQKQRQGQSSSATLSKRLEESANFALSSKTPPTSSPSSPNLSDFDAMEDRAHQQTLRWREKRQRKARQRVPQAYY